MAVAGSNTTRGYWTSFAGSRGERSTIAAACRSPVTTPRCSPVPGRRTSASGSLLREPVPNRLEPSAAIPWPARHSTSSATRGPRPTGPRRTRHTSNGMPMRACAASTITHRASRPSTDRGRPMYTIHRDYRDLVPILRHRHQPDHAAVVEFRDRPRDVRLTIDADLQRRVAAIVASYARKAKGKAAAVVLDPDTGAVLASVSYPWPAEGPQPLRRRRRASKPATTLTTSGWTARGTVRIHQVRHSSSSSRSQRCATASRAANTRARGCPTAESAHASAAGHGRSATTCSIPIRMERSTCTMAWSIRATRISRSWRWRLARRRSLAYRIS